MIRGASANDVDVSVRYGNRHRKLDGTIEFVRFDSTTFAGLKNADLSSTTAAIVREIAIGQRPVDWVEIAAWCTSPLEGNYISVKVSASRG